MVIVYLPDAIFAEKQTRESACVLSVSLLCILQMQLLHEKTMEVHFVQSPMVYVYVSNASFA